MSDNIQLVSGNAEQANVNPLSANPVANPPAPAPAPVPAPVMGEASRFKPEPPHIFKGNKSDTRTAEDHIDDITNYMDAHTGQMFTEVQKLNIFSRSVSERAEAWLRGQKGKTFAEICVSFVKYFTDPMAAETTLLTLSRLWPDTSIGDIKAAISDYNERFTTESYKLLRDSQYNVTLNEKYTNRLPLEIKLQMRHQLGANYIREKDLAQLCETAMEFADAATFSWKAKLNSQRNKRPREPSVQSVQVNSDIKRNKPQDPFWFNVVRPALRKANLCYRCKQPVHLDFTQRPTPRCERPPVEINSQAQLDQVLKGQRP